MFKHLWFAAALVFSGSVLAQGTAARDPKPTPPPAPNAKAAAPAAAAVHPKVAVHTNMGDIVIELFPDKAPKSVDNFLQYVKAKFYDGTIFHRVIPTFMIQGGGFTADYKQKPTRAAIANEANNGVSNLKGTVAMARTGDPNSATSQFFINVADNNRLDYASSENGSTWGYCVFGKVTEGMDVVEKIRTTETGPGGPFPTDAPKSQVIIKSAEVLP